MSTIEIIENLKSKIWPKIGWYDGSDDRRITSPVWLMMLFVRIAQRHLLAYAFLCIQVSLFWRAV